MGLDRIEVEKHLIEHEIISGDTRLKIRGIRQNIKDFFNGSFRETFDFLVTSNGTTITGTLTNASGGNLIMQFSDGETLLDLTVNGTIELTAGSNTSPQTNYIYIPIATKVLTKSTSAFPTTEHIKVAFLFVPSAVHTQTEGPYINQNWNDHLMDTNNQGHMGNIGERIRYSGGLYFSGIDPNGTDQGANSSYFNSISASEAYFKSSSGVIYQMHRQVIPAFDTQQVGDDIHVINDNSSAYNEISDLTDITADSQGNSLSNKYFNLFIFAVGNKTGEYAPIMCMLPDGSYSTQTSAENDVDGFDNLQMPRQFGIDSSTGIPLCRMTLKYSGGTGTLSHISTVDLRSDGITAGGGAVGATTNFADNQFTIFNVTDNTKIVDFLISGVNTSTTRTMTIPNANGILALTSQTDGTIDHTADISNVGTNTHAQVDTHIADTSDPHGITLTQTTLNLTTLDLGTNTITDGNLTGAWTSITNLTATGLGTFGDILLDDGGQDYKLTVNNTYSSISLAIQSQTSGSASRFALFTKDGDGTDANLFRIWGTGVPTASISGKHNLLIGWLNAGNYIMFAGSGSGFTGDFILQNTTNSNQLVLQNDGGIRMDTLPTTDPGNSGELWVQDVDSIGFIVMQSQG